MNLSHRDEVEEVQKLIAKTVAVNPAGRNLLLIGGFRYRFLDRSVRTSNDIDYHWSGDLADKQKELYSLFERILLPDVRRRLRYKCMARLPTGCDAESPAVRVVELVFWKEGSPTIRIEIPVEVTRIPCIDPIVVRTTEGTVYPTISDADMIESKVLAIFNRTHVLHRDLVDIFLYRDQLCPDSGVRLAAKLKSLGVATATIKARIDDLRKNKAYHARAIQEVVDTQLDTAAANQIRDAGGGKMIGEEVLKALDSLLSDVFPNREG